MYMYMAHEIPQNLIIDGLAISIMALGGIVTLISLCSCAKHRIKEEWVFDTEWDNDDELIPKIKNSLVLPPISVPDHITDPKDIAKYTWQKINQFAEQGNQAAIAIIEKPEVRLSLSLRNKKED